MTESRSESTGVLKCFDVDVGGVVYWVGAVDLRDAIQIIVGHFSEQDLWYAVEDQLLSFEPITDAKLKLLTIRDDEADGDYITLLEVLKKYGRGILGCSEY